MAVWSLSFGSSSFNRLTPRNRRGRQGRGRMQKGLQSPYACATVGGMLSSSCCLLQLALNSMSFGCAGFASLTPYRPLFLLLTASGLAYEHTLHRSLRRSAAALVLALGLTVTPQLVELYNRLPGPVPRLPWPRPTRPQPQQQLTLRVDGIKCESCAARLKSAVLAEAVGAESCTVDSRTGLLRVEGRGVRQDAVAAAVAGLGYAPPLAVELGDAGVEERPGQLQARSQPVATPQGAP